MIRETYARVDWPKDIWFSNATPKYSFLAWLAIHNWLSTGNRIKNWSLEQRVDCVLCDNVEETRNHLFFSCQYSSEIWKSLTHKLLGTDFHTELDQVLSSLHNSTLPRIKLFLLRYVFQSTIYHIWRERNARRHGEIKSTHSRLLNLIDKNIRNRLSSIHDMGDRN